MSADRCAKCGRPIHVDSEGWWVDDSRDPRYCNHAIDFAHTPIRDDDA